MSARESIVNNIIITTIIVNLVNTITTSSPPRHHHHHHHHQQQQHHAITLIITTIISSIRAQEENLSARGSGISNCVSPTNTFHPPRMRHRPHSASTWGRRGAKLCIPRPKVFSSCMETPTGSNWIQLRLCESLVDPILPFSGSNFLAWKPRGSNSFPGINL